MDGVEGAVVKQTSGMLGKHLSEETRRKISETLKNKYVSGEFDELRKKLSESNKGRIPWNKGKHLSGDARQKRSELLKGNKYALGHKLSEDARKRMSKSHLGQIAWNKGKTTSSEIRKKIGMANRGKHQRAETRKKISETLKNKYLSGEFEELKKKMSKTMKGNKNSLGYKHSEETKKKMSKSHKGYIVSEEIHQKMREKALSRLAETGFICPNIGKHEKQILDDLEKQLNYRIIRQYRIGGFFIDGYIEALNLAIEIDEGYHEKRVEKDKRREEYIKEKLGCQFLRIKDFVKGETEK